MNAKDKSLELAKLMGMDELSPQLRYGYWSPYATDMAGKAQFAAIILKLGHYSILDGGGFTQESMLDDILLINGLMI